MARKDHVRCQFFLSRAQNERLEKAARQPGVTKSAILEEAIVAFLNRKGDAELELRFAQRLDQLSKQMERTERYSNILHQFSAHFIRYLLTQNPAIVDEIRSGHHSEAFKAFVERIREQLESGIGSLIPDSLQ